MADDVNYGGLDDASFQPPTEVVKDFSALRWGAKGRGNYPRHSIRPIAGSAYMVSHVPGQSADDDETKRVRLWVNELSIGWSMEYREAQTLFGKSFYPRHIKYSDAIVVCQSADQHHYDSMVANILKYYKASLSGEASVVRFVLPRFALHREGKRSASWSDVETDSTKDSKTVYRSLVFDGYLLGVQAGHSKGVFNPQLTLRFAVIAYGDEVKSMVLADSGQQNPNELLQAYNDSLDTKKWKDVQASSQVSESGYGTFFGGPSGGPGGNAG